MGSENGSRGGGGGGIPIIGGGIKRATSTSNVAASCGGGGISGGNGGGSIRVNLQKNKIPTQGQHKDYATSTPGLQGEGAVLVVLFVWRVCGGKKVNLSVYLLRFHERTSSGGGPNT